MIAVLNYADEKYVDAQSMNSKSALKFGADKVFSFGPNDISQDFRKKYSQILSVERGNGLWLWKPYFVKKCLDKMNEGDILFYCDSGAFFFRNIKKFLKKVGEFNIIAFDIPLIEEQFTKRLLFEKMNCNSNYYKKSNQIIATYFIMKKSKITIRFVDEWLNLCEQYDLISPSNQYNEINNFIAHREDQSIFSLLCKKYKIPIYNDISQRYYFPKSYKHEKNYVYLKPVHKTKRVPVIIYLHKQKKLTFYVFLKQNIHLFFSVFRSEE